MENLGVLLMRTAGSLVSLESDLVLRCLFKVLQLSFSVL